MRSWLPLFLALAICTVASAQPVSFDSRVSEILLRMQDKNLPAREKAFNDMMGLLNEENHDPAASGLGDVLASFLVRHPDQAERVKLGLIQLLGSENDHFVLGKNAPPGGYQEEDSEYYAEVIDTVSSLDDERVIPALVGAMTTGGMAQRGLLKYGDKSLRPVMEQLKNPDALVRAFALGISINLLEKRNGPNSQERVTDLILSALKDPDDVVRSQAVREIACFKDRQKFVPTLETIAKSDPQKLTGRATDGGDGEEFYPVRYDARCVLRDIKNNKPCQGF